MFPFPNPAAVCIPLLVHAFGKLVLANLYRAKDPRPRNDYIKINSIFFVKMSQQIPQFTNTPICLKNCAQRVILLVRHQR